MKYIRFAIGVICVFTIFCGFASAAEEMEEQIQHAETIVSIGDEIELEQGYTADIVDVNSDNGELWLKLYLNGKKVEGGFVKENNPFRYLRTIEEEDDEETDYLLFNFSLQGTEKENGETSSEILIKQYRDPEIDLDKYLVLDQTTSLDIGSEVDLKEDYTIEASNLDENTVTIALRKNGNVVKAEENMEDGDVFAYTRTNGDRVMTIFMGKVGSIFEGEDRDVVFLENVAQRTDVDIGPGAQIEIDVPAKNPENEQIIIHYTLNGDADTVEVYLEGDLTDTRENLGEGTYPAAIEELSNGEYNIEVKAVTSDGAVVTESAILKVGQTQGERENGEQGQDIIDKAQNITSAAENAADKINETATALEKVPAPGTFFAIFILLGAWMWCRKR
ncbi:S-layer protein domain-containing protein [Methanohalophilus profundi]|uniref:S-layer protein domain-containing protein n=1 Tax=Methanohalophilus profundi TaxID=2138083 RepID=UPI00101C01D8|nr:S-layer protein domain-containing protein [Methanohalophilus profundi]